MIPPYMLLPPSPVCPSVTGQAKASQARRHYSHAGEVKADADLKPLPRTAGQSCRHPDHDSEEQCHSAITETYGVNN